MPEPLYKMPGFDTYFFDVLEALDALNDEVAVTRDDVRRYWLLGRSPTIAARGLIEGRRP